MTSNNKPRQVNLLVHGLPESYKDACKNNSSENSGNQGLTESILSLFADKLDLTISPDEIDTVYRMAVK